MWSCWIYDLADGDYGDITPSELESVEYDTYEKALEDGLQFALKII